MKPDKFDALVGIGFISLLAGIYLLAGLAWLLIAAGVLLIAAGVVGAIRT